MGHNMSHYVLEIALWAAIVFFVGCLIGWALRTLFDTRAPVVERKREMVVEKPVAVRAPAVAPATPARPDAFPLSPIPAMPVRTAEVAEIVEIVEVVEVVDVVEIRDTPEPRPVPVALVAARPKGISAARGSRHDNLQRISGIGPKNESILLGLGFYHFDQIADWSPEEVSWVDDHLKFNGRVEREEWVKQARLLADGKEEEFTRLYGSGGIKNRAGDTQSGERTRRS